VLRPRPTQVRVRVDSTASRPALGSRSTGAVLDLVRPMFQLSPVGLPHLRGETLFPHAADCISSSGPNCGCFFGALQANLFSLVVFSRFLQVAENLMSALLFVLDLHFKLNIFINAFHLRSLCVATLVFLPWSVRSQILFACSDQRHHRMSRMRLYASTQICRCTFK
jgi:hypothetical protein